MNRTVELEPVIDNLPSAIIVVDRDRRVRLANKMAEIFANRTKKDFYGLYGGEAFGCVNSRTVAEGCGFAPACAFCTVKDTVIETFGSKIGKTGIEAEMSFREAGKRTLRISTTYLTLTHQDVVILAIEDITDLKRMADERSAKEKLQGALEMAGAVCHELNQPMQAVSAYCELLSANMTQADSLGRDLEVIRQQIEEMGKITKKLMRITRYETKDYLFSGKRIIDIERASAET